MELTSCLKTAILAAVDAGIATLEIYNTDFTVETKADRSPLTLADKRSHDIIMSGLSSFGIPVLSEEGKGIDYQHRKSWPWLWIVDPLDGTKEFIKKNDEFTVNIALINQHRPVLGVIYVPVFHVLYFAAKGIGSYCLEVEQSVDLADIPMDALLSRSLKLPAVPRQNRPYTIVGSRSHATPELEAFVAQKRREHGAVDFISAGSSLKFCQIAEGRADIYPRLGPTMEWDTAAGQVIAELAGAAVHLHDSGDPMRYNKENLLNPWFVVTRDTRPDEGRGDAK